MFCQRSSLIRFEVYSASMPQVIWIIEEQIFSTNIANGYLFFCYILNRIVYLFQLFNVYQFINIFKKLEPL
jgi:hypothetical protein